MKQRLPLWIHYVDDTFTTVHKDKIKFFLWTLLKHTNPCILFTTEIKENDKIPFLDCLVSQNDNKLQATIYRNPTERLLDQSSYNLTSQGKATDDYTGFNMTSVVCNS